MRELGAALKQLWVFSIVNKSIVGKQSIVRLSNLPLSLFRLFRKTAFAYRRLQKILLFRLLPLIEKFAFPLMKIRLPFITQMKVLFCSFFRLWLYLVMSTQIFKPLSGVWRQNPRRLLGVFAPIIKIRARDYMP